MRFPFVLRHYALHIQFALFVLGVELVSREWFADQNANKRP